MTYACDLDLVACNILASAQDFLARDLGIASATILHTGDYKRPFSHPDAELAQRMHLDHAFWTHPAILAAAKPMPGALEAAHALTDAGLLLGWVSRRLPDAFGITQEWLRISGFPDLPLIVVGHSDPDQHHAMSKAEACRQLGASALIDDSEQEAASMVKHGMDVLLIDHPSGRNSRTLWLQAHPHVRVARDLTDAADMILSPLARTA